MPSFDIVSRTNMVEVDNALQGATREISTRYDFKGSNCAIERNEFVLTVRADDEFKLKQVQELLKGHMGKRKVNIAAFEFARSEDASGGTLRQMVTIHQGIDRDIAQTIIKEVKGAKLKVQMAIQGDELRVSGKKRDDLQTAIQVLKDAKVDIPLQFINFRE